MKTGIAIGLIAYGLVLLAIGLITGPPARGEHNPDPTVEAQPIAWQARFAGWVASDGAWAEEPQEILVTAAGSKELTPLSVYPAGCPALIAAALGWAGCAISWCESGWYAGATGLAGERGYFQIHGIHFDSTYDPAGNVAAAVRISGAGSDWGPWSVRAVLITGVCPNARGAVPG